MYTRKRIQCDISIMLSKKNRCFLKMVGLGLLENQVLFCFFNQNSAQIIVNLMLSHEIQFVDHLSSNELRLSVKN